MMYRSMTLALLASAMFTSSAWAQAPAPQRPAAERQGIIQDTKEIREDRRELRRDKAERRQDVREMRREKAEHKGVHDLRMKCKNGDAHACRRMGNMKGNNGRGPGDRPSANSAHERGAIFQPHVGDIRHGKGRR